MAFCRRSPRFPRDQTSGWQTTTVTFIWQKFIPRFSVWHCHFWLIVTSMPKSRESRVSLEPGPISAEHDGFKWCRLRQHVPEAFLTTSVAMVARDWMRGCSRGNRPLLQSPRRIFPSQNAWRHHPGSTQPVCAGINQPLQLNWCNVPESPCQWRSFGSDHRLPLLLAKSMLAN